MTAHRRAWPLSPVTRRTFWWKRDYVSPCGCVVGCRRRSLPPSMWVLGQFSSQTVCNHDTSVIDPSMAPWYLWAQLFAVGLPPTMGLKASHRLQAPCSSAGPECPEPPNTVPCPLALADALSPTVPAPPQGSGQNLSPP